MTHCVICPGDDISTALAYHHAMTLPIADLTLPLQPNAVTLRRLLAAVATVHAQALRQAVRGEPGLAVLVESLAAGEALRPLLLRPAVSVLARAWLALPGQRDGLRDRLVAALAVEAALAGKLQHPVEVAAVDLGLPRLGLRVRAGEATRLRVMQEGLALLLDGTWHDLPFATLAPQDGPPQVWPAYLSIDARLPGTSLALADDNPLPIFYDHPKRRGNTLNLGDQPADRWLEQLTDATAQLATHLPNLLDEMRLFQGPIVPVGYLEEDHQSASYPHALGTIYLTLHPRPMMMLEALIHEFQHNKLHALMQLGPLLVGDEDLRVASPVRPDPRPLRGVLLAVHAFLPVADLYRRLIEADDPLTRAHWFAPRFATIRQNNREAWRLLKQHAHWTPLAAGLAEELARLDAALSEP